MKALNTAEVYKFRDFLSNQNVSSPSSGSGRHHRCPICFLPHEKLFPLKIYLTLTLCPMLTRDLLATAKFLVCIVIQVDLLSQRGRAMLRVCQLVKGCL